MAGTLNNEALTAADTAAARRNFAICRPPVSDVRYFVFNISMIVRETDTVNMANRMRTGKPGE
jgi:hypothetical protein